MSFAKGFTWKQALTVLAGGGLGALLHYLTTVLGGK